MDKQTWLKELCQYIGPIPSLELGYQLGESVKSLYDWLVEDMSTREKLYQMDLVVKGYDYRLTVRRVRRVWGEEEKQDVFTIQSTYNYWITWTLGRVSEINLFKVKICDVDFPLIGKMDGGRINSVLIVMAYKEGLKTSLLRAQQTLEKMFLPKSLKGLNHLTLKMKVHKDLPTDRRNTAFLLMVDIVRGFRDVNRVTISLKDVKEDSDDLHVLIGRMHMTLSGGKGGKGGKGEKEEGVINQSNQSNLSHESNLTTPCKLSKEEKPNTYKTPTGTYKPPTTIYRSIMGFNRGYDNCHSLKTLPNSTQSQTHSQTQSQNQSSIISFSPSLSNYE